LILPAVLIQYWFVVTDRHGNQTTAITALV